MMKLLAAVLLLAVAVNAQMTCRLEQPRLPVEWVGLNDKSGQCLEEMRKQIQMEINASNIYLAMAAHFSRDVVNRPGFAEHFFKSAREERQHGSKLIEYLSMRGQLTDSVTDLIQLIDVDVKVDSGVDALRQALELETKVTKSIRSLIKVCEKTPNWYHLVDWLTGEFLEEQLTGQRDLAGKLSTLTKMMSTQGALGEFLYDKQL
ncbi:ferritin heavy chain [Bactrocera oleae]|uniref:ferritin heavy chain n=1 Tax=Bactrocera oleae TaxID=104688 RepID=UPI001748AA46|nr:ferritin subunit [Bactrocera oleae]XP_036224125.1 ferritin subunit [Bactrocera oleae]XP_036224126.1 ferritin subunit [Bactrocera oleae]XP_036224127.1 ferritin subunit [Bactrocera oleae]XP_036226608.1 ferritin subunit-like [Bactrocera oleae]XP_036226609.1 ferritin subunit-like [Bactrocera oleae]XP_036226610.1 ferritin subunit-like [Bactrocera oleae]XP_036226611.1 ferritin subunit-like [Bactrocera oleae]